MTRKELNNNTKFQFTCNKLALNYENAKFYEDCIFIENANHVGIVFDEEQNIIGMGKLSVVNNEEYNKMWALEKKIKYKERIFGLAYPFYNYTVKNIVDMASCVHMKEINGKKTCIYEEIDCDNEEAAELLIYIKFLGELASVYYKNCYQILCLGFDMPDLYTYMTTVIDKINESIDQNKKMELGIGIDNDFFYYSLLENIVHLLTNVKEPRDLFELANKFLEKFEKNTLGLVEDNTKLEKNLIKIEN